MAGRPKATWYMANGPARSAIANQIRVQACQRVDIAIKMSRPVTLSIGHYQACPTKAVLTAYVGVCFAVESRSSQPARTTFFFYVVRDVEIHVQSSGQLFLLKKKTKKTSVFRKEMGKRGVSFAISSHLLQQRETTVDTSSAARAMSTTSRFKIDLNASRPILLRSKRNTQRFMVL